MMRMWRAAGCLCLVLAASEARPEDAPQARQQPAAGGAIVRYESDRLTVDATDAPFVDLLAELARRTGARIDASGLDPEARVTQRFASVPLRDALDRLLQGYNFFAVVQPSRDANGGADGAELVSLQVIGRAGERRIVVDGAPRPRVRANADAPTRPVTEQYREFLTTEVDLHGEDQLAAALQGRPATMMSVFDLAFRSEDQGIRADATRVAARALDAQANAFAIEDGKGDVSRVIELLRLGAGSSAEEFIAALAAHLQNPRLKAQAHEVLATLAR
jgi:hypothetical protein